MILSPYSILEFNYGTIFQFIYGQHILLRKKSFFVALTLRHPPPPPTHTQVYEFYNIKHSHCACVGVNLVPDGLFLQNYIRWVFLKAVTEVTIRLPKRVYPSLSSFACYFSHNGGGSSGGRVVKLLSRGARGPGFDSRHRHLNFQRMVISCFQVEIWLKDR